MAVKKIPMRTCISCRNQKEKCELMRVVKTAQGEVFIDKTFKANGRGAYVCKNKECVLKLSKTGALSRALSAEIPKEIIEQLIAEVLNGE